MKAAQFDYVLGTSVQHALGVLQASDERAKLIAGSQSLGPMLNLRLARPETVVDVSKLAEMRTVTRHQNFLRVGASVTHAQIEDGVFELLRGHPIQMVASRIAYRSVRNRGTMGGSLAHADPAADWVLACAALDARIEIQSKFCKKTGEFAHASCAAYIDPTTKVARIVVGALDGAPCGLSELAVRVAAQGLEGFDENAVRAALLKALPQQDVINRQMFTQVVLRCVQQAFGVQG